MATLEREIGWTESRSRSGAKPPIMCPLHTDDTPAISSPLIRPATVGDVPAVLEIVAQLRAPGQRTRSLPQAAACALLDDGRCDLLVVEDVGTVAGYAFTVRLMVLRSATPIAVLQELVVDAAHRRRGFGSALVRTAVTRAWAAGCGELALATSGAGTFYERLGFTRSAGYYKIRRP